MIIKSSIASSESIPWLFVGGPWHGRSCSLPASAVYCRVQGDDGEAMYQGELHGTQAYPYRLAMLDPKPEQVAQYREATEFMWPPEV